MYAVVWNLYVANLEGLTPPFLLFVFVLLLPELESPDESDLAFELAELSVPKGGTFPPSVPFMFSKSAPSFKEATDSPLVPEAADPKVIQKEM